MRNFEIEMALRQRSIGRRIAQLREERHLTQEAAADRAGVTLRAYQKWEAGGGMQYANLQRLAEAFGVRVEDITGEPGGPDSAALPSSVDQRLGSIEEKLDALELDYQRHVDVIEGHLERQTEILSRIETLVLTLPADEATERALQVLRGDDHPGPQQQPGGAAGARARRSRGRAGG